MMESLIALMNDIERLTPPLLDAAFAVVAAASAISAFTPTPRDDHFFGKAYKIIEALALNLGHAKEIAPNRLGGRFVPR